jgi:hypothetical protein
MQHDDALVQVAEYPSSLSAHSIRILLEANGIPAIVVGDTIQEIGFEPIQVMVSKAHLELARTVIEEVPAASEILIPEWICICGEQVDSGFHVCWSCGQDYDVQQDLGP